MSGPLPSILLVDDEFLISSYLRNLLVKKGYTVLGTATNAEEAERYAIEKKPDIVFMDIKLDGYMNGIEAARRILERVQVKIVFMSGSQDSAMREKAMELDPLGFLLKPIIGRELEAVLSKFSVLPCGQTP
jgi:DNA-binding NarL/FixJ family response regulator